MQDSLADVLPPRQIGRYEVVRRLGAGGMGEVLLTVRHGAAGFVKAVAVKRILPQFAKNESFIRSLQREAAIAAMMHHPNCVQVNELEEVDGQYLLAMELMYGTPLVELIKDVANANEEFPLGPAARIAADTARGLAYIHALDDSDGQPLGIVHRDVSPSNVFVTDGGVSKLLDFGVATAVQALDGETRTGVLKGKYGYMSPEQVSMVPLDGSSDVFSLGIVVWEMVCGRRLFRAETMFEILDAIQSASIPPPSSLRRGVPRQLDEIVLAALSRDRARRITAAEMADSLEELMRLLPSSTAGDTSAFVKRYAGDRIRELRGLTKSALRVRDRVSGNPGGASARDPAPPIGPSDPVPSESSTRRVSPRAKNGAADDAEPGKRDIDPYGSTVNATPAVPTADVAKSGSRRWIDLLALAVGALAGALAYHLLLS